MLPACNMKSPVSTPETALLNCTANETVAALLGLVPTRVMAWHVVGAPGSTVSSFEVTSERWLPAASVAVACTS